MHKQEPYPTDLTDKEWNMLEPLVPPVKSGGRPAEYARREMVNAIFYVLRTGCQWRMLPHDFPPWQIVYAYFRTWRLDGTWQSIHARLRRKVRRAAGRHAEASAAIVRLSAHDEVLDSQSVKTTEKGGRAVTMRARK